jgi:tellurite methyltransferase
MTDTALRRKWDDHYRVRPTDLPPAARVLSENAHLLPRAGSALDLACGTGGNALFLSRHGLSVSARDISAVAIATLESNAQRENLPISTHVCNIDDLDWETCRFDVIVVSRYLDRSLAHKLSESLNEQGLLFYQTFITTQLSASGPRNPAYLLADNELLSMFPSLRVRYYREDSRCGNLMMGLRDEAYFVGQKVSP